MSAQQQQAAPATAAEDLPKINIKKLLTRLWPLGHPDPVTPDEIADAISYFFTNQISDVQAGALLMCLHFTGLDRSAEVLSKTAQVMLKAAAQTDLEELRQVIEKRGRQEGAYNGGLVCPLYHPPALSPSSSPFSPVPPLLSLLTTSPIPVRHSRHRRRLPQHLQHQHHLLHPRLLPPSRRQARQQSLNLQVRLGGPSRVRPSPPASDLPHPSRNRLLSLLPMQLRLPLRPRLPPRHAPRSAHPRAAPLAHHL